VSDNQRVLTSPPFPPLRWNDGTWEGEITLPSWAGFQSRRGAYGTVNSESPSDGCVGLSIAVEDTKEPENPTSAQARALEFLLENEVAVTQAVLVAIFADYPQRRELYDGYEDDELAELMPEIDRVEDFRALIGLSTVHVHSREKDGLAYVGFEFGCTWDVENGHGVFTHGNRVITVGAADLSFCGVSDNGDALSGG
jgi:hypothetical protein